MKKTLSVILAALMLLGMFAVSASALPRTDFPLTEINEAAASVLFAFPSLVSAEGGVAAAALTDDLTAYRKEAADLADNALSLSLAYVILSELQYHTAAYQAGKTIVEFTNALAALDWKNSAETLAIDAFLDDTAAVEAAYANGTLRDVLISLYAAAATQRIVSVEILAKEFFHADALAYATANNNYYKALDALSSLTLTEKEYIEISKKMNRIVTPFATAKIVAALNNGDYKKAASLVNDIVKDVEKIVANHGTGGNLSFWQKLWNFILKWIFFGWIWM